MVDPTRGLGQPPPTRNTLLRHVPASIFRGKLIPVPYNVQYGGYAS